MPCFRLLCACVILSLFVCHLTAEEISGAVHTVVHERPGDFAGWPANHGIWSWGDEIVVGFQLGAHKKNPTGGHDIDRDKPSVHRQARSLDGGLTWNVEIPSYLDAEGKEKEQAAQSTPIDFSNPDLALKFKEGRYFVSLDRCKIWDGPYALPTFDRPKLLARTDYLIEGPRQVTAFIAAAKDNGKEGQPLCIRTTDGGVTWKLIGWIGPQPPADYGYAIMPATVRLNDNSYFSMIRKGGIREGKKSWWVESWLSPDLGESWYMLANPHLENAGNPATLTRLANGSLALAYGVRLEPYGIRAQISKDNGQTWSEEKILRGDGASWDIGYPRTIQRADGKCVTIYYYHNSEAPERFIAATIWDPAEVK